MRDRFLPRLTGLTAAVWLLASASLANALPNTQGFLDVARGCEDVGCFAQTFALDAPGLVSGELTLDTGAGTLEFSLVLDTPASLSAIVAGGEDNGVAQIVFSGVSYASGVLSVSELVPNTWVIDPGQAASVSGMQEQTDGGAGMVLPPTAFGPGAAAISGICTAIGPNSTCGLIFGAVDFELPVGAPASSEMRDFEHTVDVVATSVPVPEPTTASLWLAGLALAALAGRRRS